MLSTFPFRNNLKQIVTSDLRQLLGAEGEPTLREGGTPEFRTRHELAPLRGHYKGRGPEWQDFGVRLKKI